MKIIANLAVSPLRQSAKFLKNLCIESNVSEASEKVARQIQGYMPVLEGYRGIACLLVFLTHFNYWQTEKNSSFFGIIYHTILSLGWCGVDAFFVLSGFLITGILLDNKEEPHYFKNFYARRILRIFPLYYFALILFLLVLRPILSQQESYIELLNIQSWYWFYLQNWQPGFNGSVDMNIIVHFWSLAIEEQFYLFWPFIIYWIPQRFVGRTIAFFIIFAIIFRNILLFLHLPNPFLPLIIYIHTFCRMDSLAIGAAIAVLVRSGYWLPLTIRYSKLFLLLSSCGLVAIFIPQFISQGDLYPLDPLLQSMGFSLLAIFFGSLLILFLYLPENNSFIRILLWFPLRQLGRVSYGFYIYHFPFIFLFCNSLSQYLIDLTHAYWISQLLLFLIFGISVFALSFLSWHILEKPILQLKRYFPNRQTLLAVKDS